MGKKKYLYGLALGLVAGGLFAGCAVTGQPLAERRMTSGPYILTPDSTNRLQLDFVFHIPENYIKKRNRLIVTPQLCHGPEVKEEYLPVVLDAPVFRQKMLRKQVLEQETDPYEACVRKPERGKSSLSLALQADGTVARRSGERTDSGGGHYRWMRGLYRVGYG